MKKLFISILCSVFLIGGYSYAMEAIEEGFEEITPTEEASKEDGKIKLVNATSWKLEVTYETDGMEYSFILDPRRERIIEKKIPLITKISVKRYGAAWGWGASEYAIDLSEIKERPKKDVVIQIEGTYTSFTFTTFWLGKHEELELPFTGNPWDAFPKAERQIRQGQGWLNWIIPRYIFDLPIDASYEQAQAAYKALSLKWHPDKWHENPELATEITKIIQGAYSILKNYYELLASLGKIEEELNMIQATMKEQEAQLPPEAVAQAKMRIRGMQAFLADVKRAFLPFGRIFYESLPPKKIEVAGKGFRIWDEGKIKEHFEEVSAGLKEAENRMEALKEWMASIFR